jgi:predicted RNA-binding Zn-ribbon protein involved in translation (DUF1610 family)
VSIGYNPESKTMSNDSNTDGGVEPMDERQGAIACPKCGSADIKDGVCTERPNDTHDYGCRNCRFVWDISDSRRQQR